MKPQQVQAELAQIISVRAGRQFSSAQKCVDGLLPQGRWRHPGRRLHGFVPL